MFPIILLHTTSSCLSLSWSSWLRAVLPYVILFIYLFIFLFGFGSQLFPIKLPLAVSSCFALAFWMPVPSLFAGQCFNSPEETRTYNNRATSFENYICFTIEYFMRFWLQAPTVLAIQFTRVIPMDIFLSIRLREPSVPMPSWIMKLVRSSCSM